MARDVGAVPKTDVILAPCRLAVKRGSQVREGAYVASPVSSWGVLDTNVFVVRAACVSSLPS